MSSGQNIGGRSHALWRRSAPCLLAAFLTACGGTKSDEGVADGVKASNVAALNQPVATEPLDNTSQRPLTLSQAANVCKAGVGILMGRDPKTMTAKALPNEITRIEYKRPSDGKLWKHECRIDGDRVITRGVDMFGNDGPGRWRDGLDDEVITFKIAGDTVAVHDDYGDGSTDDRTYRF